MIAILRWHSHTKKLRETPITFGFSMSGLIKQALLLASLPGIFTVPERKDSMWLKAMFMASKPTIYHMRRLLPPAIFAPYFMWAAIYQGKFFSEDVRFMGGCDRFFIDSYYFFQKNGLKKDNSLYYCSVFSGVDEENIREWGAVNLLDDQNFGIYYKDGMESVVSNNAKV